MTNIPPHGRSSRIQDAAVIALVGVAHATSHVFHLMIPSLFPALMEDYGLSYTHVGSLTTAFFLVSGVGQAFAGLLVDRWGAQRVLCLGTGTLTLSGCLLAAAPDVSGLYLASIVAGLGNSVFHPADFALLNRRVSPKRLGHAFAVHGLSGNLGWAMGSVTMIGVSTAVGWRVAGLVAAGIGAATLATLWLTRRLLADRSPSMEGAGQAGYEGRFVKLVGVPSVIFAFLFFFFSTLVFGALQNFAPSLFRDLFDLSLTAGASALTAYLIGSATGIFAGGFLAGRDPGEERLLSVALLAAAVLAGFLGLSLVPSWSVVGVMFAMGICVGLVGPARDILVRKAIRETLGADAFGRAYGLVYSGLDVGLATAPLVFGLLLDAGQPRGVFFGIAMALICAIAAAQAMAVQVRAKSSLIGREHF